MKFVSLSCLLLGAWLVLDALPAAADCGSVPFYSPLIEVPKLFRTDGGETSVHFDPLEVSVFEPRQRAIILWNGQEEILLLSTDQRASQAASVLEVIPLPAEPKVALGEFKTFELAQKLVVEKHMWACAHGGVKPEVLQAWLPPARVTFRAQLGVHDLTVAQVLDSDRFADHVQGFLKEQYGVSDAPIRPEFLKIIQRYTDDGFRWFVFDVITLGDKTASRQPVEYRFASDEIYYPLRISTLERGNTEVELLVFAPEADRRMAVDFGSRLKVGPAARVATPEIAIMNEQWNGFFAPEARLSMDRWKLTGRSSEFSMDLRAE